MHLGIECNMYDSGIIDLLLADAAAYCDVAEWQHWRGKRII